MKVLATLVLAAALGEAFAAAPGGTRAALGDTFMKLTRETAWKPVESIPITFTTHHPQGMVKIGDAFFVSAVEVTVPTHRFTPPAGGYDRDTGAGVGHLFKFDRTGHLIEDLKLGEGSIYHPGGLDYDGTSIWVPVAEYRPNSHSIVYRVDPSTMRPTAVLRFADHIGAVIHNTDDNTLHGVSWGSRRFYRWTLDRNGRVTNANATPERLRTLNASHYVDYQDCKYAGRGRMLCTGVTEFRQTPGAPLVRLGGMDLVDLRHGRPIHQLPVLLWTATGFDMTHNPAWIEANGPGLRAYFMPEDDKSTIYIYDVK